MSTKRAAGKGVLVAALLALMAMPAVAAPPPGTDLSSPEHAWFERQHNIRGMLCCSEADGHILDADDWRSNGAAYEVRINGQWITIPDDTLRDTVSGGANPMNAAIVWYMVTEYGIRIWCFAPWVQL